MIVNTNKPKLLHAEIFDLALEKTSNKVENVSANIKFVRRGEIRALNRAHRNIDKVTDVLSFPMLELGRYNSLQNFENERDEDTGELELGDIAICLAKAKQQAKQYGHSLEREVNFLALHGFLHLLGFDHMNEADEKQMFSLAEEILSEAGIGRGKNV